MEKNVGPENWAAGMEGGFAYIKVIKSLWGIEISKLHIWIH